MKSFFWNIVLALLWAAALETVTPGALATGFVVGFVLLTLLRPEAGPSPYASKLLHVPQLAGIFLWELLVSNVRVALEVARPRFRSQPAIYGYDMEARTDAEVTLLSLMVTFTPGTIGLEVSEDRKVLYVHVMFAEGREAFSRHLRERLERPLLRVLR